MKAVNWNEDKIDYAQIDLRYFSGSYLNKNRDFREVLGMIKAYNDLLV